MGTAKIINNKFVLLPRSIFKPTDKIVTFLEGETLIVKKLTPTDITKIASREKGKAIPLHDIVKEIHRYRKQKRSAK